MMLMKFIVNILIRSSKAGNNQSEYGNFGHTSLLHIVILFDAS